MYPNIFLSLHHAPHHSRHAPNIPHMYPNTPAMHPNAHPHTVPHFLLCTPSLPHVPQSSPPCTLTLPSCTWAILLHHPAMHPITLVSHPNIPHMYFNTHSLSRTPLYGCTLVLPAIHPYTTPCTAVCAPVLPSCTPVLPQFTPMCPPSTSVLHYVNE